MGSWRGRELEKEREMEVGVGAIVFIQRAGSNGFVVELVSM